MTGRTAVVALAFALLPARLHAQDTVFTVGVPAADVHKGPSIATPVIGHVSRGTAIPVLRDLGSWVKIDWPGAPDGFGYLHLTTGRIAPRNSEASTSNATVHPASPGTAAGTPSAPAPHTPGSFAASGSAPVAQPASRPRPRRERVVIRSQQDSTPISHVVGVGGLFGPANDIGATARAWRDNGIGLQITFTRDAMISSVAAGRVASMQVEPAVVYGLFDHVSDYFWLRPYVGAGISIRHQTLHDATPAAGDAASSSTAGFRLFGGGEVTFAGAPRFGLSVDAGYRRFSTDFSGFEPARFTAVVSGHWYVK